MTPWLITAALTLCAAPSGAKSVFLNGVNIDGVTNQKFENATVVIDDKGNDFFQELNLG